MAAKISVLGLILRSAMVRFFLSISNLQSSPATSSWGKGTFSDKTIKMVDFKVTFLLLSGFLQKLITTRRDMSYPLWFNFMSIGQVLKLLSKETLGTFGTRHSLHCRFLKRPSSLSWINSSFLLFYPESYSKCMWQATSDSISGRLWCLDCVVKIVRVLC